MIKSKNIYLRILAQLLLWVGVLLLSTFFFLVLKPFYSTIRNGVVAQSVCACLLLIPISVGLVFFIKKKLTFQKVLLLAFIISYIVCLCYMLTTPYGTRQYDTITNNYDGHEAYAFIIYNTGKLPVVNDYQFYHPPLNAAIQAGFMQIMNPILNLVNTMAGKTVFDLSNVFVAPSASYPYQDLYVNHNLYMTTQILSLTYSMITSYFFAKLVYRLDISNKAKFVGMILAIFFPRLIQMAAQENNDMLTIMFSSIALYYTYVFYRKRSWLSIIVIAISIGCAMMAKLSGATIALSIGLIFLLILIEICRKKEKKSIWKIILQFVVFLCICAPLGLWFQVYAKIRFDQPLGFVFSNLNHELYVGDVNAFSRFINIFDFYDYFRFFYAAPFDNYNLPTYMIKTALFGEFSYWQGEGLALVAMITNWIFTIGSLVLFVIYFFKSGKEHLYEKIFAGSIVVFQLLCQLYFNIKMPYGCTMDFRYIVPIIPGFAVLMALSYDKFRQSENKFFKWFTIAITASMVVMLISSNAFYMVSI